jgi:predicted phosphodiesterase
MKKEKKLVAIGDIHGSSNWKKIIQKEEVDTKVLFIGDYFDSFFIPPDEQIKNFKEIVKLKLANPENVILITGNHDLHYLVDERYSGFQAGRAAEIKALVAPLILDRTMIACHQHGKFVFTHAGISRTWCKNAGITGFEAKPLPSIINDMLLDRKDLFCYAPIDKTGYGESMAQGPMWIRPDSLIADPIEGYTQVVGHTHQEHVDYQKNVIFIDTLDSSNEYLSISNGKAKTKKT